MSKKQKRTTSQSGRRSTRAAAPASENQPSSPEENTPSQVRSTYTPSSQAAAGTRRIGSTGIGGRRFMPAPEFKPDYSYVVRDLKRIGILAGSFFGILIILSFILK